MAKYKIVKGSFGIGSIIYKADTKNDIIESDKDLSKRDGIEKFAEIKKDVVNIAPAPKVTADDMIDLVKSLSNTKETAKNTEKIVELSKKPIEEKPKKKKRKSKKVK